MTPRSLLPVLMLSTALFVAGCESAEEKAEGYYQSALALMEEGDVDRALIELRNVFQYDGFHLEARQLYADTLFDRGNYQEAYSQYLRLIEQYPNTVAVRQRLAEMALDRGDAAELERHGAAAIELAPEDLRSRAIAAWLAYRTAAQGQDRAAMDAALAEARAVLEEDPDNTAARRLVVAALLEGATPTAALPDLELLLEQQPQLYAFQRAKLGLLVRENRMDEAEAHLEELYRLFPDNPEVPELLLQWYLSREDSEAAEVLLRDLAGEATGPVVGHGTLVQFLLATKGAEAAIAELDGLIAANAGSQNALVYGAAKAGILFDTGEQESAITLMQGLLDGAEPSDEVRAIKVTLARMLQQTGDRIGARALIEEVLAEDSSNVDALLMRAGWKTEEDDPDGALGDLRIALDQDPRNPTILMLMAQAHQRAGQPDLAAERLALAAEVSDFAPEPSLLYARFLRGDGQASVAVEVLSNARRAAPDNLEILAALAELQLQLQNWGAVEELRQALLAINTEASVEMAQSLQAAALIGQNRTDEGLALIQDNLIEDDGTSSGTVTLVMTLWNSDRRDQAREMLDEALAETPQDPALRMLDATMRISEGDLEGAEAIYRAVAAEFPEAEAPYRLLYRLLNLQQRGDEALEVLEAGLAANPDAYQLLQIKAAILEYQGDIDGAIAIYERQYAQNSNDLRVANNLASLIATHRADPAELERAWNIARRLRGIQQPALQDTYGWAAYTQGDYDEALSALEPAAEGLPNDPIVQYHLGMTYAALDRGEEAIEALTRAIELGEGRDLPQMAVAAEKIAELQAAAEAAE